MDLKSLFSAFVISSRREAIVVLRQSGGRHAGATYRRFVRRAMAVITTEVRPSIAGLIWREAVAEKKR